MNKFAKHFADAKHDGLGVTLHIAEVIYLTWDLTGFKLYPDRG
jgi:hypothetical protein